MNTNPSHTEGLVPSSNPDIFYTDLPVHWKSNKKLPKLFMVEAKKYVPNGTNVIISAGNDANPFCTIKNFSANMINLVAVFDDLRFVGRSSRGKTFQVTIGIYTETPQYGTFNIKITAKGPPRDHSHCSGPLNLPGVNFNMENSMLPYRQETTTINELDGRINLPGVNFNMENSMFPYQQGTATINDLGIVEIPADVKHEPPQEDIIHPWHTTVAWNSTPSTTYTPSTFETKPLLIPMQREDIFSRNGCVGSNLLLERPRNC